MHFNTLRFGRHVGKSLPYVILTDPDWFFWAKSQGKLKGPEAEELYKRATAIRIPERKGRDMVVEYVFHPKTGILAGFQVVPNKSAKIEGAESFRMDVIDLSVPKRSGKHDKLGCKLMVALMTFHLFGKENYQMTQRMCEDFFNDDRNFKLQDKPAPAKM